MATLLEFRYRFPGRPLCSDDLGVTGKSADYATCEVPARVHQDFDSGTKYISYFVASGPVSRTKQNLVEAVNDRLGLAE